MKQLIPTVTVAISAYNEEHNIKAFLQSVLRQKEDGFLLREIWVFSDGSTDKTVSISKSLKSKKIKVIDDKKRVGKSSRLNQIYKKLNTDFLVQSDADVIYAHPFVIRDIIAPLIKDKKVGMCGGDPQPVKATTFTEKAVNCTFYAYAPLRHELRGGNNIYSVDGRILAYRKALVKKIHVPADTTANDAYTYFTCITNGYEYRYVQTAVVLFRSPQTLKDQIKQNTRFLTSPVKMGKHFSKKLVAKERFVPQSMLLKNMLTQFIQHPVLCTYIILINLYCKFNAWRTESNITAMWDMVGTTKVFENAKNKIWLKN